MASWHTVTLLNSRQEVSIVHTGYDFYFSENAGFARVEVDDGYCRACCSFTSCEHLPLDPPRANEPTVPLLPHLGESLRRELSETSWKITRAQIAIGWQRQSPPKCLTCGSREIVVLHPQQVTWMPEIDDLVLLGFSGLGSMDVEFRFYDSEGNRISEGRTEELVYRYQQTQLQS